MSRRIGTFFSRRRANVVIALPAESGPPHVVATSSPETDADGPAATTSVRGRPEAAERRGEALLVLLAEFEGLKNEIADRSKGQEFVVNLAVVSTGAIVAFVLGQPDRRAMAVVLAFVCSVLGALWIDHARTINNIGVYFANSLWPQLRELTGRPSLTTREDWVRFQESELGTLVPFFLPLLAIFVAPAGAALIYSWSAMTGLGEQALWAAGCLLAVLSSIYWIIVMKNRSAMTHIGPPYESPKA